MTRESWTGDSGRLNACFVAALVTGRLFLNVLGVGKKNGKLVKFDARPDDVNAEDLGGKLIDLTTLLPEDHALFIGFLTMVDKAAAHFTLPSPHDWTKTDDAILRIHHYLRINLYHLTKRPVEEP